MSLGTGILGAGPSGLAMSLFLDGEAEILEKEDHPGGHSASYGIGGFTFDYGPHIMFSKNQAILDFMVRSLGENVHRCRRNNKISFKDRLVKYPFENDLKSLPLEDNFACLKGFVFNPYKERYPNPSNMKEWLLKTFGEGICERYLIPYNEKVWNVPVEKLSMSWASRIPNPPADDILKSSIGFETEGYVHQLFYHYPKKGGYQAICEEWAKGCSISYGFDVKSVEITSSGRFIVGDGKSRREYDRLVSTIPVQILARCLNVKMPAPVREAMDRLIVNPMYVVSFGIRGEDPNQFTAIYFPESEFLVNRISYPCTFSPWNGPEGHHSIQAEITCTADSAVWKMTDREVLDHVRDGLIKRGLIRDAGSIVVEDLKRKDLSYVVYDVDYERNVQVVRDWFDSLGIRLVGRFSYFEYVNVDMAVERALKVSAALMGRTDQDFKSMMESALLRMKRGS